MNFDYEQAKIIYKSEKAHFFGLRSSSITGPYNEDLLISVLKLVFPTLSFGKGNIVNDADVEIDGFVKREHRTKGKRRPQVDIIIYKKGKERFGNETYCVVEEKDVIACIELKKWLSKKDFGYYLNSGAGRLKWETRYGKLPFLVVGFRIRSSRYFNEKIACTNASFVFSKMFSERNGFENEPWNGKRGHIIEQLNRKGKDDTERIKLIKENILIRGELERLVMRIKNFGGV